MKLKREWVEELIFGAERLRRFLQDSPVLPDVWLGYAKDLDEQLDLLITPFLGTSPGELSQNLEKRLLKERQTPRWQKRHANVTASPASARIAYNQANVVVRLWFDELIRVVLPLSSWYRDLVKDSSLQQVLAGLSTCTNEELQKIFQHPERTKDVKPGLIWLIRLIGSFELALKKPPKDEKAWEKIQENLKGMVQAFAALIIDQGEPAIPDKPLLWNVSRNRELFMSVSRSVPSIKADAAFNLFNISCRDVTWAIIDTGIDAKHEAFFRSRSESGDEQREKDWADRTRVEATFDFTLVRHLLGSDPASDEEIPAALRQRLEENPGAYKELRQSIRTGREIDWTLLEPFIAIPHDEKYDSSQIPEHGTHVAGILGADSPASSPNPKGVCPDIKLYDLRVFDKDGVGDEFSVIAALQFIRHVNAHKDFLLVKGVNLSLSIHHDVANFACGRTPVCEECERLVGAGVVVVAAAGNQGYLQYMTTKGPEEGYRSISITDPGNTEGVITVGSTHSFMPHTYGVSYFSSRGPTADGRLKPDLVAPGEKVESTVPGSGNYKVMDGTSMAAPHVSGAAALLIARNPEMAGQPRRIKQVLCDSATNLGRERYFQGAGMVDVLRALQSV